MSSLRPAGRLSQESARRADMPVTRALVLTIPMHALLNWTKASTCGAPSVPGARQLTEFLPLSLEAVGPVFSPPDEASTLL